MECIIYADEANERSRIKPFAIATSQHENFVAGFKLNRIP